MKSARRWQQLLIGTVIRRANYRAKWWSVRVWYVQYDTARLYAYAVQYCTQQRKSFSSKPTQTRVSELTPKTVTSSPLSSPCTEYNSQIISLYYKAVHSLHSIMRVLLSFLALAAAANAFTIRPTAPSTRRTFTTTALHATASSRRQFVVGGMIATAAVVAVSTTPFLALAAEETTTITLPNGVSYTIQKKGTGPEPSIGELAAIRFKATAGDNVIDDIFDTPEPYYTRIGSGGMLKGVEAVLPMMKVGDRWTLTIPVRAFKTWTII
jgi:FKBP-type peptidyl-prolyl cis-trans isomerase